MKFAFIIVTAAISASSAFASDTKCSSADQRFSSHDFTSNGGAHMSSELITLDGNTVYERINWEVPTNTVGIERTEKVVIAGPFRASNGAEYSTYAEKVTLTQKENAQVQLFSGFVICEEVIGPICHMCP